MQHIHIKKAAVITLPSKTLFIIPHKETLLGLIHSKQHLNIRPFAGQQQQGQVPQGQGNPQQQQGQGQVVPGQNPQVVQGQNPQQAAQAQAAAAARRAAVQSGTQPHTIAPPNATDP